MVTRARMLLATCLLLPAAAPGANLEVQIAAGHTGYGVPVRAEIVGRGLGSPLHELDLEPLREDFGIVVLESTTRDGAERRTLDLYPRRTGTLTVPALYHAGQRSKPATLRVDPATDGDAVLSPAVQWPARDPWQREQMLVSVELAGAAPYAELVAGTAAAGAVRTVALPSPAAGSTPGARLRTGWALFNERAGIQTLDLPPVEYRRGGRTQGVFYFPRHRVRVRALPRYLPPTLPVGRVTIHATLHGARWLRTGALALWQIRVTGNGIAAEELPPVLRSLQSTAALEILPADSLRSGRVDANGIHGEVLHTVAVRPLSSGRVALPDLSVQYFDPDNGRIVTVRERPRRPLAMGLLPAALAGLLLAALITAALRAAWRAVRRQWRRTRARRLACTALETATRADAVRAALRRYAAAEGWPVNLTLRQWTQYWRRRFRHGDEVAQLLMRLSHVSWSATPGGAEVLARELARLLRHPRRLSRARAGRTGVGNGHAAPARPQR